MKEGRLTHFFKNKWGTYSATLFYPPEEQNITYPAIVFTHGLWASQLATSSLGNIKTETLVAIPAEKGVEILGITFTPQQNFSVQLTSSYDGLKVGTKQSLVYVMKGIACMLDRSVTTGLIGSHSNSYTSDVTGTWSVIASWEGDATHDDASNSSKSFTVLAATTFPWWILGIGLIDGVVVIVLLSRLIKQVQRPFLNMHADGR